ncbi:MAG TPA: NIL domain-containing protein [bacterium]|nr:NIL domain-containing protein [bacterium]
MTKKSAILHFKAELVERPVLSGLIRDHDVSVNILQASVTPDEDGTMFVQVDGEPANVKRAFAYLDEMGVRLVFPAKNLVWDEERCTSCGACVAQCLPKALAVDEETNRISLDDSRCIACELCIPACPFGALESVTEHLG